MLDLKLEKAADVWQEIDSLAKVEYDEVERGLRPYGPDWESVKWLEQSGTLKILTARKNGRMIGYFTFMLDFDMESKGTLIANQCSWFVEEGHFGVAARMFKWAVKEWKRLGVKFAYLHNAQRGRGKTLGKFFTRIGAVHVSNTYALRL